jgi:hypothetical protein
MNRAIVISSVALLALGACGKKTDTAATGTAAPANATATAAAPSGPMDMPARKAGMWEMTIASGKMNQTMSQCIDQALDKKMKIWGAEMGKSECAEQTFKPHLGGGIDFHSVCKMGESGTVTSDGSATGDFSSHYTVTLSSVTSGSPMPQANGPHTTTIDAAWKGPCPADMKPGDMKLANGMTINMAGGGASVSGMGGKHSYSAADVAKMRKMAEDMAKAQKQ